MAPALAAAVAALAALLRTQPALKRARRTAPRHFLSDLRVHGAMVVVVVVAARVVVVSSRFK
eukprot:15435436-Alexandrium_andersonii.AAC.1